MQRRVLIAIPNRVMAGHLRLPYFDKSILERDARTRLERVLPWRQIIVRKLLQIAIDHVLRPQTFENPRAPRSNDLVLYSSHLNGTTIVEHFDNVARRE